MAFRRASGKILSGGLLAVLLAATIVLSTAAKSTGGGDFETLVRQYDQSDVGWLREQARQNGIDPTDADLVGVLEFRQACYVLSQALTVSRLDGQAPAEVALRELPADARARGQAFAADVFRDQLLTPALNGDLQPIRDFVARECDPNQDLSKSVRR